MILISEKRAIDIAYHFVQKYPKYAAVKQYADSGVVTLLALQETRNRLQKRGIKPYYLFDDTLKLCRFLQQKIFEKSGTTLWYYDEKELLIAVLSPSDIEEEKPILRYWTAYFDTPQLGLGRKRKIEDLIAHGLSDALQKSTGNRADMTHIMPCALCHIGTCEGFARRLVGRKALINGEQSPRTITNYTVTEPGIVWFIFGEKKRYQQNHFSLWKK